MKKLLSRYFPFHFQDFWLTSAILAGASLTCEGADTLEDLKLLESEGVTILTCGTCLDFYGLKEKLAVGGVTNMYDIVERMENARTIVKP